MNERNPGACRIYVAFSYRSNPVRGGEENPALNRQAAGFLKLIGDKLGAGERHREIGGDAIAKPGVQGQIIIDVNRHIGIRQDAIIGKPRLPFALQVEFKLVSAITSAEGDRANRCRVVEIERDERLRIAKPLMDRGQKVAEIPAQPGGV